MTSLGSAVASTLLLTCSLVACAPGGTTYDLVLEGGRVLDPETGLDEVANVGIRDGTIARVSERDLHGKRVIDASGLVVAPGFIDLHEHGQTDEAYRIMVRDGVTTALELEVGTGDVDTWYAGSAGGQRVNYGASIGHIPVRMDVLGDPGTGLLPAGVGGSGVATPEQLDRIEARIRRGLDRGALAVGFGSAYTPGATMDEIERMFRVAAEYDASIHIHMRGGVAGLDSTIAAARRAGAPLHIVHVNSSAEEHLDAFLAAIRAARDAGQDVTTETYPYGAGMTEITSALFDDWREWSDERIHEVQRVATGERLTRETFGAARKAGGTAIIFSRTEEQTRAAVSSPLTMIASDGFIEDGRGHPRTSGSYSKVLGRYVREERLLPLPEAVAKMTIMPARRLEARAPVFARKGRLREGMDADITVFDPATVVDRSTYEDPTEPAAGIPYVIVGGQLVVDGGELTEARPGVGVRAPIR
ncbi:MAG TPA: amidohydrolase family protein [Gemmatimonadota bacterium]|nr:amidohydrolase family protein [Gemmatimonadota bacterium]